jgi:NAD(P)-dependent dehydrogenase (short-subunit alcohol dehydrogenase family)
MSQMSIALVCGATGGLGPAVVAAFRGRGDQVIAVARSHDELAKLSGVTPKVADLTRAEDVDALWASLEKAGTIPRWVVNATGGYRGGTVVDTPFEDFNFMLSLNLVTAWLSSQAAASGLMNAGGGAIVNVASRSGLRAERGSAAYSIAKAAVVKLTEVLAEELKDTGVRVNAVVPAVIDTPRNRAELPTKLIAKAVAPESIAAVIAFLCSDDAQAITGAIIPVYGRL